VTGEKSDAPQNQGGHASEPPLLQAPAVRYIHSDVWQRLVLSSDDLTGIVAYGLYQLQKREWIAYHEQRYGCLPSEDAVKNYSVGIRDAAITALRNNAEGRLFRFGEVLVSARLPEMQERAFNNRTKVELAAARDELKKVSIDLNRRTGYLHHIICHVLGFGERLTTHNAANTPPTDATPDVSTPHSPP
jgi:hypothetical protein